MSRCPVCEGIIPVGSNCLVDDTNCFDITGTGTEADPYVIEIDLSSDSDQIATCDVDGLRAIVPTNITDPPAAQAYHASNQSIPNNTMTAVSMNSELYDTDTMHSTSTNTNRMVFPTAGVYTVTCNLMWYKNTTGDRVAQLRKNGTDILILETKDAGGADLFVGHSLTLIDNFAANDYIEARVQQTSGGALLLMMDSLSPVMTATRVA